MEFENFNIDPEEDDEDQEENKKQKSKKSNLLQNFFSKFKSKDGEDFKLSSIFELKIPVDKSLESKPDKEDDKDQEDSGTSTEIVTEDDTLLNDPDKVALDNLQKINIDEGIVYSGTSTEIVTEDEDRIILQSNPESTFDKSLESKPDKEDDKDQEDSGTSTEIVTEDEDRIILQSIADIHLSELPHVERNTKVEYFLTNLSSTGDLHKSYSISSSQFENGEITNEVELSQPVSQHTIIETSRTNFEYKKSSKKYELPKLVPIVSEKKKSAFEFLNNEIYRIKTAEKPIESSVNIKVRLKSHLEKLDNQVEVFKLRIRDEIKNEPIQTIPEKNIVNSQPIFERNQDRFIEDTKQVKLELSDKEIILISEKIKLENVSLKQIFKNREISLNGMRRVVKEYLATGNFEEILKKELILHQIDFEKDPIYKDVRDEDNIPVQFNSPKSVEDLLAEKNLILDNKNILPTQVKLANNQNIKIEDKLKSNNNHPTPRINNPLNIILLSLILILLIVLILVLYFKV